MIEPTERTCCGCRACEKVCPAQCIAFLQNSNGFLMPKVDTANCIGCGVCEKTCPVIGNTDRNAVKHVYSALGLDSEIIKSTSGGIFYILAMAFLSRGGVIFGAAYDNDLRLQIVEVNDEKQLSSLQGSKYLQADTADTYGVVRNYLMQGKKVLYSGTPCQIAGLRSSLRHISTEGLLTIEIICHGTPSPKMFSDYLEWVKERKGKKVDGYQFRTKAAKGRDFCCLIEYGDGSKEIISGFKDPFYKKYMAGTSYREICYECPFAKRDRASDITLGDFWNIEDLNPQFQGRDRVSLVLINSAVGENAWKMISGHISFAGTDLEVAVKGNPNLTSPTRKPEGYMPYGSANDPKQFFDDALRVRGNIKKEVFNLLPVMMRKGLKRLFK